MFFVVRSQLVLPGESLVAQITREGPALVPGHVVLVVTLNCKPFLALATPIAVVSRVTLVMLPQSTFSTERFVAQRAVVLLCDGVDHREQIITRPLFRQDFVFLEKDNSYS